MRDKINLVISGNTIQLIFSIVKLGLSIFKLYSVFTMVGIWIKLRTNRRLFRKRLPSQCQSIRKKKGKKMWKGSSIRHRFLHCWHHFTSLDKLSSDIEQSLYHWYFIKHLRSCYIMTCYYKNRSYERYLPWWFIWFKSMKRNYTVMANSFSTLSF